MIFFARHLADGWVGFIDWLDGICFILPIAAKKEFWSAGEHDRANNCYDANPFPAGPAKRQKSKAISERGNSARNQKRSCEAAVNSATTRSVDQTRCTHERERCCPQNHFRARRCPKAKCEGTPWYAPEKERARRAA